MVTTICYIVMLKKRYEPTNPKAKNLAGPRAAMVMTERVFMNQLAASKYAKQANEQMHERGLFYVEKCILEK